MNDRGHAIGESHPRAKLSNHEIDLIHELRADGMRLAEIAEKFDISKASASYICAHKRRAHTTTGQKQLKRDHRGRARPARLYEFEVVGDASFT